MLFDPPEFDREQFTEPRSSCAATELACGFVVDLSGDQSNWPTLSFAIRPGSHPLE
jgi:hypothetical protein